MDFYKAVDNILKELTDEYASKHERTTKALNYEYFSGQLHFIYKFAETALTFDEYIDLISYRKQERDEISRKFNLEIINPIYSAVRSA